MATVLCVVLGFASVSGAMLISDWVKAHGHRSVRPLGVTPAVAALAVHADASTEYEGLAPQPLVQRIAPSSTTRLSLGRAA
jgi:hypothetical protein